MSSGKQFQKRPNGKPVNSRCCSAACWFAVANITEVRIYFQVVKAKCCARGLNSLGLSILELETRNWKG